MALVLTLVALFDFRGLAQPLLQLPTGAWGGDHIGLEVTDMGAKAEFDCAHGSIDEPLILDSNGRFDAKGSYVQESPGPQREGQPAPAKPARYAGRVQGATLTLNITLIQNSQPIGPFSLTKDRLPRITKCG